MIPHPHRAKGAGPLLGTTADGEPGPFGTRGAEDQDDGQDPGVLDLEAAVDARVQQLVAQARARRERQKAQRRALEAARQAGLAARHRAKLGHLDNGGQLPDDAA